MKSLDQGKEQKYYGNLTTTTTKERKKDKMTGRKMTGRKNDKKEGTIEEIRKKGHEKNNSI